MSTSESHPRTITVEGVKLSVRHDELKAHIESRVRYHKDREAFYAKQVDNLQAGRVAETYASNDPISSLRSSQESHKKKAALFQFMAGHLIENAVYILSDHDFSRLELVDAFF